MSIAEEDTLLERFRDDDYENVVKLILAKELETLTERDRKDARRRAKKAWVDNGQLKTKLEGWGDVIVLPAKEGPEHAHRNHSRHHLGKDLALTEICRSHWWASVRRDITNAIEECPRCCQFGTKLQRLSLKPIIRYAPFDLVAADFLYMPVGEGGHNMVIVMIDCFTRFLEARSFKGTLTSEKAIKYLDEFGTKFVFPRALLLDNEFDTKAMRDWAATRGSCELIFSAPYAHVGLAENANHLVLERLRRLSNLDIHHMPKLTQPPVPKRWVRDLPQTVSILNERVLPYLGNHSPKELLFGPFPSARNRDEIEPERRLLLLQITRGEAISAFAHKQRMRTLKSKTYIDYVPEKDDLVLIYHPADDRTYQTGAKLRAKWQGPMRVTEVRGGAIKAETLEGRPKEGWVGMRRVKRWRGKGGREGENERNDDSGSSSEESEDEEHPFSNTEGKPCRSARLGATNTNQTQTDV
ncbi:hypothetical protein FFLO_07201 [Filobasidium floriforme]|uniref:Integrase catalytic domain-containing protein n=1 Tax=Filobasidium floriforme TaxID=5210 RepID=A0A8K0JDD0_9TREE|nr:hypothetical protein FFLO_07201 [Filobasidium floriforme]